VEQATVSVIERLMEYGILGLGWVMVLLGYGLLWAVVKHHRKEMRDLLDERRADTHSAVKVLKENTVAITVLTEVVRK